VSCSAHCSALSCWPSETSWAILKPMNSLTLARDSADTCSTMFDAASYCFYGRRPSLPCSKGNPSSEREAAHRPGSIENRHPTNRLLCPPERQSVLCPSVQGLTVNANTGLAVKLPTGSSFIERIDLLAVRYPVCRRTSASGELTMGASCHLAWASRKQRSAFNPESFTCNGTI